MEWIEATEGWLYDAYVRSKKNSHRQILVQVIPYRNEPIVLEARVGDCGGTLSLRVPNGIIMSAEEVTHWMPMPNPKGGVL